MLLLLLQVAGAIAELAPPMYQQQGEGSQQPGPPASASSTNWQKKGGGGSAAPAPAAAASAAAGNWAEALGTAALLSANTSSLHSSSSAGLDGTERDLATAGEAAAAARGAPRQQLLVVASLLSKLPNLAGLARTCEVFG
jgi:hypothetical protein